jgi:hypothetical protein
MASHRLAQEHQQLQVLLKKYRDISQDLPNLKVEETLGWVPQLREWFQDVVRMFLEWLNGLMGPLQIGNMAIDWPLVSQILFWLCVAFLVFWLTSFLTRKSFLHKMAPRPAARAPTPLTSVEESLQHRLDAAVHDANWGLAARLRWRLFLYRMRCQPHVTPDEFFRQPLYRSHWEQIHGASVIEQYRVMFAAADGSRLWFDHYHDGLTRLEGASHHA